MLNAQQLKEQTPGARARLHLDNAGSALMSDGVLAAMRDQIDREAMVGGYLAQEQVADTLGAVYADLARLLNAPVEGISLHGGASDAWARLVYSIPFAEGDRVLIADTDYCGNVLALQDLARRRGIIIDRVPMTADNELDLAAMAAMIRPTTRLISLVHVPSSSGQVHDVSAVGRLARDAGVLFLLDACQSIGQLPVSLHDIGCDMLTGTARKFLRGPRGVGFMALAPGVLDRLQPTMLTNMAGTWETADHFSRRSDARIFEAWERNVAGQLGLGQAVRELLDLGVGAVADRICSLADQLRAGLTVIPGVTVTDPGTQRAGIVTFTHDRLRPAEVKARLEVQGIAGQVTTVHHTRLDLERRGLTEAVRLSPHVYVTEAEIQQALSVIEALG